MSVLPENRIVLAPLAGGPSTPELTAAVGNAGGLPFLGAGYLTPAALAEQLERTRALTGAPFGVNIFTLCDQPVDDAAVDAYADELQPEAARWGVTLGEPRFDDDGLDAKVRLALGAGAAVVSFTFGCPSEATLDRVRRAGAEVWLTVTSVGEARAAVAAGADVLVVQGDEAGGHRGSWQDTDGGDVPLLELVRATTAVVDVPLVATGGIADRDAVLAALEAGAAAAQIGSAFLLSPEAGTNAAAPSRTQCRRRDGDHAGLHRPPSSWARERVHARAPTCSVGLPADPSPDCTASSRRAGSRRPGRVQSLGRHERGSRASRARGRDRRATTPVERRDGGRPGTRPRRAARAPRSRRPARRRNARPRACGHDPP